MSERDRLYLNLEKNIEKNLILAYTDSRNKIINKISSLERKGVLTQSEIFKYNRLLTLQNEISDILSELGQNTGKTINQGVLDSYKLGYDYESYRIENELNLDLNFALINERAVIEAIKNPLSNVGFLQRNDTNVKQLANKINLTMAQGIIQGYSYRKIANEINKQMNIGADNANRLARTEVHRAFEKASLDKGMEAQELGIEMQKMWVSAIDDRTRESHVAADGQTVPLNQPFIVQGESLMYPGDFAGSASNVIHCRCTSINIIGKLSPKVRRIGKEIVPYTTFTEWFNVKS